jgi:hypothetical protein
MRERTIPKEKFIRMDLDLAIGASGIPYGYTFQQSSTKIVVTIDRDRPFPDTSLDQAFDPNENSIFIAVRDEYPLLVGILYARIDPASFSVDVRPDIITVTFTKATAEDWPLIVADESSSGIDPKSQFVLAVKAYNEHLWELAWAHLTNSAAAHFCPALLAVSQIYNFPANPCGVKSNPDECIRILISIYREYRVPEIGIRAALTLKEHHKFEEAKQLLEECMDSSPQAKLILAKLLSPIFGELNDAERAVELFESLSAEQNADAMRYLAAHYSQGMGVRANQRIARRLSAEAEQLSNPEKQESRFGWTPWVITISVLGVAALLYFGRRHR